MAGGSEDRSLEETSTWSVAIVCAVFIVISIVMEHGIQSLGKWFQKREKRAMIEALEKIKSELMLLGFISLLLTVGTTYIVKICVSKEIGNKWLPCGIDLNRTAGNKSDDDDDDEKGKNGQRKLISYAQEMVWRRSLAAGTDEYDHCYNQGKVSLISYSGVHQLHIFIFVLAVMHVLYSVVLMALGHAKMKKWKAWELETSSLEYQFSNDPARFRFAHQTSFVRRHAGIYSTPVLKWIVAFFRQFFGSISKVDYMAIRHGFINAHFAPNTKFDFHKYIKRSMEDDYKSVLGIRYNAYQMAYFLWKWYEFGITSCLHEKLFVVLIRVFLGVALLILCSYITFPLYALVTQMGSHQKKAIFEEQTTKALKKWHQAAKQRKKLRKAGAGTPDTSNAGLMSGEASPSQNSSPLHLLHNNKYRSNAPESESMPNSPMSYLSDNELSEIEPSNRPETNRESHNIDFSFIKS
ncbi:hypothetical protein ACJIZ3_003304 [Penstemon smallii]|uniref:MLO-like protein n=1 Tax=Penstemon smallii TaxID=265156 RepID=A0ABD3U8X6_9LAMI